MQELENLTDHFKDFNSVSNSAFERGQLVIDFAIREIPVGSRKMVADLYPPEVYERKFGDYVAVAIIVATGDHLIVPQCYKDCSIVEKSKEHQRPNASHVNHADFVKIINERANGSTSKES